VAKELPVEGLSAAQIQQQLIQVHWHICCLGKTSTKLSSLSLQELLATSVF
jgi:hypothetical protein